MNIFEQRMRNVIRSSREALTFGMSRFCDYECGTPGCHIGNYAARGDLQQDFMLVRHEQALGHDLTAWWPIHSESGDTLNPGSPEFQAHFGITQEESLELFDTDGCGNAGNDRELAIKYLEDFCARKWPVERNFAQEQYALALSAPIPADASSVEDAT
jgi:hypothetical protein